MLPSDSHRASLKKQFTSQEEEGMLNRMGVRGLDNIGWSKHLELPIYQGSVDRTFSHRSLLRQEHVSSSTSLALRPRAMTFDNQRMLNGISYSSVDLDEGEHNSHQWTEASDRPNAHLAIQNALDYFLRVLYDVRSKRRNTKIASALPFTYRHGMTRRRHSVKSAEVETVAGIVRRTINNKSRLLVLKLTTYVVLLTAFFVIVESELQALHRIHHGDPWSVLLRSLTLLLTVALLVLIVLYHAYEVQLIMIDSGTDDWRVAVSWARIVQVAQELLICSICPLPGLGSLSWPYLGEPSRCPRSLNSSEINYSEPHEVPLDVLLVVPMFLRFYLIGRYMVVHSHSFQDAATRSIAALNRVSVDFKFVLKTLMREKPLRVLVMFTVIFWISISWFFTQCERHVGQKQSEEVTYLNSLWLIVISFLSIGYGDVVPHTYCGRMLAISSGVMGIGVASALIAVVSRMLDLTKAEKHVNAFMADTKLTRQRNHAAASVLQETWHIYKHKYLRRDEVKARFHQRRFLAAITEFRRVKWEQRKLMEHSNRLIDVGKIHTDLQTRIVDLQRSQTLLMTQIQQVNGTLHLLMNHHGIKSPLPVSQSTEDIIDSTKITVETELLPNTVAILPI